MHFGGGIEPYIVEDACQPPVVLALQEDPIRKFVDIDSQSICAWHYKFGDVVLRRLLGSFVVPHLFPVDPYKGGRGGLLHPQEDPFPFPGGR